MAISRIQGKPFRTDDSSGATTVTLDSNVTAASMLSLTIANYPSTVDTVTDDKGNSWSKAVANGEGGDNFIDIWYAPGAAAGSTTLSITPVSGAGNYLSGIVEEWAGAHTTAPLDRTGISSSSTVGTSANTTEDGELVLVGIVVDVGTSNAGLVAPTTPNVYTRSDVEQDSTFYSGYQAMYRLGVATGGETTGNFNPLGTQTDSVIATFKVASGGGGSFNATLTEAATAATTQAATAAQTQAVTEAATATTTQAATAAQSSTLTEAATATDAQSATLTKFSALTEAGTATEVVAATKAGTAAITEAATATDTPAATMAASAALTEAATAIDSQSATTSGEFNATLTEAATATDVTAATLTSTAAVNESATATEAQAALRTALADLTEAGDAREAVAATMVATQAVAESSTATDSQAASAALAATLAESATATDSTSALAAGNFLASITETANATDALDATRDGPLTEPTGQGSGGPHRGSQAKAEADDGVPRISMRAKRDRDAAEFARQQAEEVEAQAAEPSSDPGQLLAQEVVPKRPPLALQGLMDFKLSGWPEPGLWVVPPALARVSEAFDPAGVALELQSQARADLVLDDEEALAVIEAVLSL